MMYNDDYAPDGETTVGESAVASRMSSSSFSDIDLERPPQQLVIQQMDNRNDNQLRDASSAALPSPPTTGTESSSSSFSSSPSQQTESNNNKPTGVTIPLVEVSLENVTYAPITRSASSSSSSSSSSLCRRYFTNNKNNVESSSHNSNQTTKRKVILQSITTTVSPYKLTAWMGPSGSGKTSLITATAGLLQNPNEDLSAESIIRVNGTPTKRGVPGNLVGVVWQDDLLLSNLTVEETVRFAARLKSPAAVTSDSKEEQRQKIDDVVNKTLHQLGLTRVRTSLIGGGHIRGISGGERKRVAVAVELVSQPSVLLLDEPTSGLDATSARGLIETLGDLSAHHGHAIAVVVHQPNTTLFRMFDELLLLSRGRMIYNGAPCGARGVLEACPGVGKLPQQTGIADWIMDVITDDENRNEGRMLPDHWAEFQKRRRQQQQREQEQEQRGKNSTRDCDGREEQHVHNNSSNRVVEYKRSVSSLNELLESIPKFQTSFWTQFRLLTKRSMKQRRGERLTRVALLTTLAYTALTGLFWFRLPDNTDRIYERISLLFFILIAQSNGVVVSGVTTFQRDVILFRRERAKKMYGVLPYFLAKTIGDATNAVLLPCFYGAVTYWLANLRPDADAFFAFVFVFYVTVSTAQSVGSFLSIAIPGTEAALMFAPLINIFLMILGGFYIPLSNMRPFIEWMSWFSFARYGFSAFIINEFVGRDVPCADSDDVSVTIGTVDSEQEVECPIPGEDVVESLGVRGVWMNLWLNIGLVISMQVALRVACYILLRRSR